MSADFLANVFRFTGDALLVASRAILVGKIYENKSVSGLSLQTQAIYLIIYLFRYLDLFHIGKTSPKIIYNTVMKVLFIAYQLYIIYLMVFAYKNTYSKKHDTFFYPALFVASFFISIFVKSETTGFRNYIEEYLYTNSLILECVAILPQLLLIQEAGDCETMTSQYILLLGLYRLIYVLYFAGKKLAGFPVDYLLIVTGIIQFGLYVDFFAVYYKYVMANAGYGFSLGKSNKKI